MTSKTCSSTRSAPVTWPPPSCEQQPPPTSSPSASSCCSTVPPRGWRPTADNRRLAKHLTRQGAAIFTFLTNPDVDATNWRAEQAIRPAVVNRKVWGGNRTDHGARTWERLVTVLTTCRQQGLDTLRVLIDLAHRPAPALAIPIHLKTRQQLPHDSTESRTTPGAIQVRGSSSTGAPGADSTTSSSPPSNTSTGSTTGASTAPSPPAPAAHEAAHYGHHDVDTPTAGGSWNANP